MRISNHGICKTLTGKSKGFSYVEVLIALSIAAVSLISLLGLHVTQVKAANHTRAVRQTLAVARSLLAEQSASLEQSPGRTSGTKTVDNLRYDWQKQLAAPSTDGLTTKLQDNLMQITVTVRPQPNGPDVELSTLVRKESRL